MVFSEIGVNTGCSGRDVTGNCKLLSMIVVVSVSYRTDDAVVDVVVEFSRILTS